MTIKSQKNVLPPPITDRGVQNTSQIENEPIVKGSNALFFEQEKFIKKLSENDDIEMLFDWVQVTVQEQTIEQVMRSLFNIHTSDCLLTESGRYGYNRTFTLGSKIHVMDNTLRFDMGVHILLSGSACRELEKMMSWQELFHRLEEFEKFQFTRIDIAIDCYKQYFTIDTLRRKIKKREVVSKFRNATYIEQINICSTEKESASLKFGSMSSDIYVVFYDKLKERKNAGYTIDKKIDFWHRVELRFKHDLSNQIYSKFVVNNYEFGDYVQSILYHYIDFKKYHKKNNAYKGDTAKFWIQFLCGVKKLSLTNKPLQSSIQIKMNYAQRQFSKTVAMLTAVDNQFYKTLVLRGYEKMKDEDLSIINSYLINENIAPITMNDLKDILERRVFESLEKK